ncbi:hypothetical protein GOV13_04850 [Candidatus Pacearchaeota archaeon]|nr:hypothetical protein [Candidatus Pacearchaeota archaeon]
MAKAKTTKQLDISIKSLKKKLAALEMRKKKAVAMAKKKSAKKKPVKRKVKRKVAKRKKAKRKPAKRKVAKRKVKRRKR